MIVNEVSVIWTKEAMTSIYQTFLSFYELLIKEIVVAALSISFLSAVKTKTVIYRASVIQTELNLLGIIFSN